MVTVMMMAGTSITANRNAESGLVLLSFPRSDSMPPPPGLNTNLEHFKWCVVPIAGVPLGP